MSDKIFDSNPQGLSAEYWCGNYHNALWAIGESDRLHLGQIAALERALALATARAEQAEAELDRMYRERESLEHQLAVQYPERADWSPA